LGSLVLRLGTEFELAAEGGMRSARNIDRLRSLASQADAVGLTVCARYAARLANQLDDMRHRFDADIGEAAGVLLRGFHVIRMAGACELLEAATAWLA
jgi:hypothetical protein